MRGRRDERGTGGKAIYSRAQSTAHLRDDSDGCQTSGFKHQVKPASPSDYTTITHRVT